MTKKQSSDESGVSFLQYVYFPHTHKAFLFEYQRTDYRTMVGWEQIIQRFSQYTMTQYLDIPFHEDIRCV